MTEGLTYGWQNAGGAPFFPDGMQNGKKMEDKHLSEVKFSGQSFTGMEKQKLHEKTLSFATQCEKVLIKLRTHSWKPNFTQNQIFYRINSTITERNPQGAPPHTSSRVTKRNSLKDILLKAKM